MVSVSFPEKISRSINVCPLVLQMHSPTDILLCKPLYMYFDSESTLCSLLIVHVIIFHDTQYDSNEVCILIGISASLFVWLLLAVYIVYTILERRLDTIWPPWQGRLGIWLAKKRRDSSLPYMSLSRSCGLP